LAEIIFQSKDDAEKCYHHLLKSLKLTISQEIILLVEEQHIIKIAEDKRTEDFLEDIKRAFYVFITEIKRNDWFKQILIENYFFHEPEEQNQIMEILYSILEGERKDLTIFLKEKNEEMRTKDAVKQIFLDHSSFSFDSFVKFRLRPYLLELESFVKVAIDEYKMEQEYQMFVYTLREFLFERDPKMEVLHLLLDEEITFYNEGLEEIKRGELSRMIDRKLLVNHPVYVDSASIAPLLSIAPTTIFLYTKDPEEALVRTIKNIFEERVSILPYHVIHETIEWAKWWGSTSENSP
jgi:putative sporulation protein YtxC